MSACIAESLDGHEHNDDVIEYVGICVRGHQRRGPICSACARPLQMRGPVAVTCAECPDDDPRPRILVPADVWDATRVCPRQAVINALQPSAEWADDARSPT